MPRKRKSSRGRRRYFRRSRRAATSPLQLVPTLMGAGAGALPFVDSSANGYSVLDYLESAAKGGNIQAKEMVQAFIGGIKNQLPEMIGLGAGAAVVSWAGRKFRLSRATRVTKKLSIF